MDKARKIIAFLCTIIFIILLLVKKDMPREVFLILSGIIMINHAVDEYKDYLETNKKSKLVIPIGTVIVIIISIPLYFYSN